MFFSQRKVTYIKKTSQILKEKYDGDIPKTVKELCTLSGESKNAMQSC